MKLVIGVVIGTLIAISFISWEIKEQIKVETRKEKIDSALKAVNFSIEGFENIITNVAAEYQSTIKIRTIIFEQEKKKTKKDSAEFIAWIENVKVRINEFEKPFRKTLLLLRTKQDSLKSLK